MIAIHSLRHEHAVTTLCRVLQVNRSTYYKFRNRKDSHRAVENRALRAKILALYIKSDKRLGTPKMTKCLAQEYRIHISCGRVYRLMKTMNLPKMSTVKPPKQKARFNAEGGICRNLLQQQFKPEKPNMAWVCDFTYLRAGGRFYYLCAVMDLFSRRIIAFRLSARINTDLAIATLEDAIRARGGASGVMFHTDRGSQFTAKRFRQFLDQHNMIQSFSAKGYPYDNAVMECFFRYLKHEETNRRAYSSLEELQAALFHYIYGFYNSMRPHSHNNGLPPIAAEAIVT